MEGTSEMIDCVKVPTRSCWFYWKSGKVETQEVRLWSDMLPHTILVPVREKSWTKFHLLDGTNIYEEGPFED